MSRTLRFLPLALLALLMLGLVWRLAYPSDTAVRSQLVGQAAPAFTAAPVLPGRKGFTSAALADGKPKLVNFFASWCVPCIVEAPVLMELKRRGVTIEGIAVRDRPQDVARFLRQHGDPFASIGGDPESKVQFAFGSAGVPESFVIDGRGVVRLQHVGPIAPGDVPAILRAVEAAR
ncbi:MAG: redoxin family protein [Pseudomonadota bacterium]|jgi:cytochrome c biogenesis protein CcmG/thiol:disulfide interchange protein DsbE|nr:redoxin family protein [Sphingomonas sp.]MDQ3471533.1 redoxin family protein [Pseudomonadota bacterium]